MELKVWVEGIQRIVCGVSETTTCQDVVFALAHATGKIGRFTLIERWRNNERLLAPTETPLKILMKWGEYSSDVQFILQRSDQTKSTIQQSQQQLLRQQQKSTDVDEIITKPVVEDVKNEQFSPIPIRNNLNLENNIGIVKPQKTNEPEYAFVTRTTKSGEFNSADIRNSLNRKISPSPTIIQDSQSINELVPSPSPPPIIGISAIGALVPPPYRNPPKPRSSPLNQKNEQIMKNLSNTQDLNDLNDVLINNANYKDLIQLIKYQRDKIHMQQADITKFDAEIGFLENKERDQIQQLEAITREIKKTDVIYRQGGEQLQTLQYVEEENELVKQQEKTLKSEITLLRSKLANCKTELLQCKNKVRLLMDEIQIEQRVINRQYDNRQQIEKHFLTEYERIQSEIDSAVHIADSSNNTTDSLKHEVAIIENAIAEKKKQVEQLVNEMKEVNLQSLAVAPSDEVRNLLEGSCRPGSTRKMIGSPRQLENAVPTSKNPHGVWV